MGQVGIVLTILPTLHAKTFALDSSLTVDEAGGELQANDQYSDYTGNDTSTEEATDKCRGKSNQNKLLNGWVIGYSTDDSGYHTAAILHTENGGRSWRVQVDKTRWPHYDGNDISAVDSHTAWAALGSNESQLGKIIHTTNGGWTWIEQTLPEPVDQIKGVKGLTRYEAWAVSLAGTILHTTDGGKVWSIVDHSTVPIVQVNRIDAIGYRKLFSRDGLSADEDTINANVWIADDQGGNWGMIHTLYNGELWRQEDVPYDISSGVHMVSAYSLRVAWAAAWGDVTLFRTTDGGETWKDVAVVGGQNDLDDMCSPAAGSVWVVQNQSGESAGSIFHVQLQDEESPTIFEFNPAPGYVYGGLTCIDDQSALAVGYRGVTLDDSMPEGVIVSTIDGGQNWIQQRVPVDVKFWKTSFVGARR